MIVNCPSCGDKLRASVAPGEQVMCPTCLHTFAPGDLLLNERDKERLFAALDNIQRQLARLTSLLAPCPHDGQQHQYPHRFPGERQVANVGLVAQPPQNPVQS